MLNSLEYLSEYINIPAKVIIGIVLAFLVMQIVGEVLEFKGKVVPEFMKIRKRMQRKKQEEAQMRATLKEAADALNETKAFLAKVEEHYNADNIAQRNGWMKSVNDGLAENARHWEQIEAKLTAIGKDVLEQKIETKRNMILDFATRAANPNTLLTREIFRKIYKIHSEYETIIEENGLENGEVDDSFEVIQDGYQERLKNGTFLEDMRGYAR